MGLDMYLERKRNSTKEEVGYWRKANQIFRWIIKKHPEAHECNEVELSIDELKELTKDCFTILFDKNKAKEILPPMQGFFFGSYEYDSGYFYDIGLTIEILTKLFLEHEDGDKYYFHASW